MEVGRDGGLEGGDTDGRKVDVGGVWDSCTGEYGTSSKSPRFLGGSISRENSSDNWERGTFSVKEEDEEVKEEEGSEFKGTTRDGIVGKNGETEEDTPSE